MSTWETEAVLPAVEHALASAHLNNPGGHHFGRPYLTAYQLAIKVDASYPSIRAALGTELGGRGVGSHNSFAQYLARELSRRIKRAKDRGDYYSIEGAFVSNEHLREFTYAQADGTEIRSSLTGTNFDLSLYRLAAPPTSDSH